MGWWIAADLLLALGLCLRLTRFVTNDSLSRWYLRNPAVRWANRSAGAHAGWDPEEHEPQTHRQRLVSGLYCAWCASFHLAWITLLSLWLAGGPGDAHPIWRYVAGAFALSQVTVWIGGKMGDYE